jgi:hypothetical protein
VAAYSQFLGYKVVVQYRVGEMLLSATGTFAADSGRSIFLEQHLEQRGTRKYFRWEIPYPYIHHIQAETESVAADGAEDRAPRNNSAAKAARAGTKEAAGDGPSFGPIPQRPKTA